MVRLLSDSHFLSLRASRARSHGQVLVISAFAMIVFIGLIGTGVDYGVALIEETQLQNALDAASLAGARALVGGSPPGVTSAEAVARDYLRLHGYESGVLNTTVAVTFPPGVGGGTDTINVAVSRRRPTYFWHVFGIPDVTIADQASAQTGKGMFDVVFSADQTASMSDCGSAPSQCGPDPNTDMGQLRQAAADFVNQLNPSATDPRSSRIALVQFQGQHHFGNNNPCVAGNPTTGTSANACLLDAHVLQELTADRSRLLQLINGPGGGCPAMPSQPANFYPPLSPNPYRCPFHSVGGSGTYILAGIQVAFNPGVQDLWSTARGGRVDAKKAMVIFTDGQTNVTTPDETTANSRSVAAANAAKRGADGIVGTRDDVEIFVVGLFHGSEAGATGLTGTNPPGCPRSTGLPGGRTVTDDMLIGVSSSTAGTCDHYYPLSDRASLPQTFRTIAGALSRGRLTQ
jgi:hypothetical protein